MRGLSAFPITPSDADGVVRVDALRRLLRPLVDARVHSIGLLGSTGSYPYLARAERRRAIEAAVEEVAGRVPLLVGVGALRTDEAIRLAQDARAIGAAAGLLAAVSYTPLTEDEVFEHFAAVARESGLPLCIYDNPTTTHFRFTPELIARLAGLPGVIAIKLPGGEPQALAAQMADLRARVPADFAIGHSGDWFAVEAMLAGGEAWYSVAAGILPNVCMEIATAVQAGDAAEARRLNAALEPLWALFREFSSLRVVYEIAERRGVCAAEPPLPVRRLPEPARRRVAEALDGMDPALLR